MKVLAINGSARKDGNTALLINTDYEKSGSEYGVFAESTGRKQFGEMSRGK
nr:hypothetical protein [uncultured Acetatifactor sp.]